MNTLLKVSFTSTFILILLSTPTVIAEKSEKNIFFGSLKITPQPALTWISDFKTNKEDFFKSLNKKNENQETKEQFSKLMETLLKHQNHADAERTKTDDSLNKENLSEKEVHKFISDFFSSPNFSPEEIKRLHTLYSNYYAKKETIEASAKILPQEKQYPEVFSEENAPFVNALLEKYTEADFKAPTDHTNINIHLFDNTTFSIAGPTGALPTSREESSK